MVAQNDRVVFQQAYGNAVAEFNIKNTVNTKFGIASLSKPFTKLALLQLAETGALKLSDKLSRFILDYPNGDRISINHLINHSSGVPNLNDFSNYHRHAKENYSIEEAICLFKHKPLEYQPGTDTTYSNSGLRFT